MYRVEPFSKVPGYNPRRTHPAMRQVASIEGAKRYIFKRGVKKAPPPPVTQPEDTDDAVMMSPENSPYSKKKKKQQQKKSQKALRREKQREDAKKGWKKADKSGQPAASQKSLDQRVRLCFVLRMMVMICCDVTRQW